MAFTISLITAGVLAWALWTRRHTWRVKWETASTTSICLLAVAVLMLSSTPVSTFVGCKLHHITHVWNLQFWLGHLCALGAMCAVVYNAVSKLDRPRRHSTETFHSWFFKWIQTPTAIGTLIITALFANSDANRHPMYNLGTYPSDGRYPYLTAYWIVLSLMLIYLLYHGIRAFHDLKDDETRLLCNLYLAGCYSAVICLGMRILTAVIPQWDTPTVLTLMAIPAGVAICTFAYAAGLSWITRLRSFTKHVTWSGGLSWSDPPNGDRDKNKSG
ncbi:hypothetical protein [Mycobacterium colombiense]|nr:hypothetical protein [Mycobacterium colombiense]